ncbi:Fe(3+) ABC transporter substrate-binding protein [Vineibacter terrae]|uniref:Fe(3+) ABC transporter substrate-binding protein n=1 Tax=Vineibacter terrae TaxID=2586908 RepID=A0A5C8P6K2_9HYPH|nr:Fe(3+) ABC transporter substrate-binding protein [Vineibacter terrae]TXL69243.1 Fe(3+) ABC transporter substrate-binding protein [Vineibacter terrae]
MKGLSRRAMTLALAATATGLAGVASAQDKVVNLYSARHYQTDEKLYEGFTRLTGIKVNRIEGKEDEIIERIRNEGANSPADLVITVDMGRIWKAEAAGLLGPVKSAVLEQRVPANLRDPEGRWFGFSTRARVLVYAKDKLQPAQVARYEDIASPGFKGKVCVRSGGHVYNLSLLASIIATQGEEKAEAWAKGVVAHMARPPQGGDTDQIKAVAAGQCDVAIANSYYVARIFNSTKDEDKAIAAKIAVSFPNQGDRGAHVNVSGGGMVKTAPNKDSAIRFLEYLVSDEAQRYFANGNNEYPVAEVKTDNKALESWGTFKMDQVNVGALGRNQAKAQAIFDKVGWK